MVSSITQPEVTTTAPDTTIKGNTTEVKLEGGPFPITINVKDYREETVSKIRIDEISYVYDNTYLSQITITIDGSKTDDVEDSYGYDSFKYKLYDSEGYMMESGSVFLDSALAKGDRFKEEITIYDIEPGQTYTIKFYEDD